MSECSHDCSSCASKCDSQKQKESFLEALNPLSSVKKVIGVVSGKGGVGKSLITSMLAVEMNKRNFKTAILDADITGPSIPKAFGITEKAQGSEQGVYPCVSKGGVNVMSINLLLPTDTDPVVWRGPVIAGAVKQFWTDIIWDKIEYMFVDMPPGTGDVPLTVFQSLPIDGIVIVTTPQELVDMIVTKAVRMAQMMNVPILGIVENMSYFKCPDCDKEHYIFGKSNVGKIASENGISEIAKLPINPEVASAVDNGNIESVDTSHIKNIADVIEKL